MAQHKIVGSFITSKQEFQLAQAEDARSVAEAGGLEFEALFADGNAIKQIQQLFWFVHLPEERRPYAILVEPISADGYERVAQAVVRAGIGWVVLNAQPEYLASLRAEFPRTPITSVMTDQIMVGRIQARQFRTLLPKGGTVLYVQGIAKSDAATGRLNGLQDGLARSDIELVAISGDWTEEGGERAVDKWLRSRNLDKFQIDLIGCQNDSMAIGARRAVRKRRPRWLRLPFTGCDGLPNGGQSHVESGRLVATVVTPSNGGPAVRLVIDSIARHGFAPPVVKLAPAPIPEIEDLILEDEKPSLVASLVSRHSVRSGHGIALG